jgi:multidrug efflux pump subunit AcrB
VSHKTDEEIIAQSHNNIPKFCVDWPQVTWVLLILVFAWGIMGYKSMPQRKDPDVPVKTAAASCDWPGATAEQVEQQIAYKIEQAMSQNSYVKKTYSQTTTGTTQVRVDLADTTKDTTEQFSDINLKLLNVGNLPQGAGPIQFNGDFGDTAALMLTVASPLMNEKDLAPRIHALEQAIRQVRVHHPKASGQQQPFTLVLNFPTSISPKVVVGPARLFDAYLVQEDIATDVRRIDGPGYVAFDGLTDKTDAEIVLSLKAFVRDRMQELMLHPDAWEPCVIRDPSTTKQELLSVAGPKYSYRELDDFTDLMQRGLRSPEIVSKVQRSGVLQQTVYLDYSQDRLATYGLKPSDLPNLISARNITMSGGQVLADNNQVTVYPTGQITDASQLENMLMTITSNGTPVYLRDVATVVDGYQDPPDFLTFLTMEDAVKKKWQRYRAVTLAIQMKSGQQINVFGEEIDRVLDKLKESLPKDLIIDKTSNQPEQVAEKVDLLMVSLYKAIFLVVVVSLIGFWDWRSALLMALSIPITLAMTFGMMWVLGIDLQQVSIATLIIALGLLVDDPVVAGDAIKHGMGEGLDKKTAAWLGPTKLATATTFATITNIVAYLPFLGITGDTGEFLYSLPVVMTCSLVASRIASMTFVPFLGYVMLRPLHEPPVEQLRTQGFYAFYTRVVTWAVHHRLKMVIGGLIFLSLGFWELTRLPTQFFPTDLNPLFYVDVWAPENCSLAVTNEAAHKAEKIIEETAHEMTQKHGLKEELLHSIATYVGGGSPRFWSSLSPQQQQLNYAQVTVQLTDQDLTTPLVNELQGRLSKAVPGIVMDVRQLQTGKPVDMPCQIRIVGEDIPTLRMLAAKCEAIFRKVPLATRIRDDWGVDSFSVDMDTSSSRANISGFTNYDVASSSYAGLSGTNVGSMRVGHKVIPIATRMRIEERSQLSDLGNMYVFSNEGTQKVPLSQVSQIKYSMKTSRIQRRWQHRCITVGCFPLPGHLASEVMNAARKDLNQFFADLPTGYEAKIDGEEHQQNEGFLNLVVVMAISVIMIYMALVAQFKNAVKPFIVAAAVPFGLVGAVFGLAIMNVPFGFMSFLGIISLMGVIVSHIIVLFDFIEEAHAKGDDFEQSLIDAGIMRLRPVMITVGATITALFPLATDGGPLWQPLCYAQIGGLGVATFITLLLVPVIYTIFVKDLKLVKWEEQKDEGGPHGGNGDSRKTRAMPAAAVTPS